MKKNKLFWILTVVCVLNFAAHLYFYPSLPDIVPTHWGASGQVNGWGPKSTVLFLAAIPFVTLILFEVIRKIDPKHQNFEKFGKAWNLFVGLFTVMSAAFSWLSELAVFGKLPDSSNLVSILVCGSIGVRRIVHHPGQFYAADQAELYLRLPHALGAERRAQLAAHPAHGRVHLCRYGHCPVGACLPGRPAGRHCYADRAAGYRSWRQRVDLFVFVSGVCGEDEVRA